MKDQHHNSTLLHIIFSQPHLQLSQPTSLQISINIILPILPSFQNGDCFSTKILNIFFFYPTRLHDHSITTSLTLTTDNINTRSSSLSTIFHSQFHSTCPNVFLKYLLLNHCNLQSSVT